MRKNKKEILGKLFSLHRFGIKPGLERTLELLEYCENPHKKFKSIHVAGTNGKGSVCSMLNSLFVEAGYKCGLYTSPHILDFNERIRINGSAISDEEIVALARLLMPKAEEISSTFFEITTTMAFLHFANQGVDMAIIEAGMGGRYDSTSVIDPELSIITSISLDHREYLGNTIEEIAFDKAHIIKPNGKAVISRQTAEVYDVIDKMADWVGAEVHYSEDRAESGEFSLQKDFSMTIDLRTPSGSYEGLSCQIGGLHQAENLKTFITAFELLEEKYLFGTECLRRSLAHIRENSGFKGRCELISPEPPVLIDVAHNPESMAAFIKNIEISPWSGTKWNIVFGAMKDKDLQKMLEIMKPVTSTLFICSPDIERAFTNAEIYSAAMNMGFESAVKCGTVENAVEAGTKRGEAMIITGSFYVLGEAAKVINII
jgi:dihydrofolate synthase / folylpolyglutamate synthase